MKVLITGASGMIGSALTDALLKRGDDVAALTRNPERAGSAEPRVAWHAWDPQRGQPPTAAFQGIDALVNLMGEPIDQRWTDEAKKRIMQSRRDATQKLAQAVALLAEKPGVVVSGSAVGYYGDRGTTMLDEGSTSGLEAAEGPPGFDTQVISAWEESAEGFANVGIRMVRLRTGHVLSATGGMLKRLLLPFRLGLGGPMAGGRQCISWVHIDDVVGIILWTLDRDTISGPVNATAPGSVTNEELAKALGRVLRRPAILPLPGFALDLILGRELAATLKGGQRVVPKKALESGYRFQHPNLDEALADLLRNGREVSDDGSRVPGT